MERSVGVAAAFSLRHRFPSALRLRRHKHCNLYLSCEFASREPNFIHQCRGATHGHNKAIRKGHSGRFLVLSTRRATKPVRCAALRPCLLALPPAALLSSNDFATTSFCLFSCISSPLCGSLYFQSVLCKLCVLGVFAFNFLVAAPPRCALVLNFHSTGISQKSSKRLFEIRPVVSFCQLLLKPHRLCP